MEEIALEPPKAKKDVCWRSREVVVISTRERERSFRRKNWIPKRRRRGMLVARDWVIRRRVRRSWIVRIVAWDCQLRIKNGGRAGRTVGLFVTKACGKCVGKRETEGEEDDLCAAYEGDAHLLAGHSLCYAGHQLGGVFIGEGELECDGCRG